MADEGDQLDVQAMQLSVDARDGGIVVFSLRLLEDGNVRLIGPGLNSDLVVKMLRDCAHGLEAGSYSCLRTN